MSPRIGDTGKHTLGDIGGEYFSQPRRRILGGNLCADDAHQRNNRQHRQSDRANDPHISRLQAGVKGRHCMGHKGSHYSAAT